jgi:phosphotransferase system enzyme I (PtsI)
MINFNLNGIPVSSGISIGKAKLLTHALMEVEHYTLDKKEIKNEIKRFNKAITAVKNDLNKIKNNLLKNNQIEFETFINTHVLLLKDKNFSKKPIDIIQDSSCNAEWAIKISLDEIVSRFDQISDPYLRERKLDVIQVAERITKYLLGHPGVQIGSHLEPNSILVAHDISPADAIQFKQIKYAGFITEVGGTNSHTAILARSLNIPSIVGSKIAKKIINNDDLVILDGDEGVAIINPNQKILDQYKNKKMAWAIEQKKLQKIKKIACNSSDGETIKLMANIEDSGDIKSVRDSNADGIGLFRTEFLFMNREDLPDEEEQFKSYKSIVKSMRGREVIIRTLDSGADKMTAADKKETSNPALGLRAIRLCLSEPRLFMTQLRAILRASYFGKIKILIPMISSIQELKQVKLLIERAKLALSKERIKYDENIEIGGMIEVPAVAINADFFAKELDFLSIGTNDLIQYTLAIDRTDDSVSHLYNSIHPSVLKLMALTINAAKKHNKEVAVCGEMAGDTKLTRLLLAMGLTNFSMHPASILQVKQKILETNIKKIKPLSSKILKSTDSDSIESIINKINL